MPFSAISADVSVLDQVQRLFRADSKDKLLHYGSYALSLLRILSSSSLTQV